MVGFIKQVYYLDNLKLDVSQVVQLLKAER